VQMLHGNRSQNIDTLIRVSIVLGVLLIVLVVLSLLGFVLDLLHRFKSEIFLFIIGALLAYLMAPLVRLLQRGLRRRWAAVLCSYLILFVALVVFAILLINPFISQARSLVDNLRNPAGASLQGLRLVQQEAQRVRFDLATGQPAEQTGAHISSLQRAVSNLTTANPPHGQIRIPPSYITPIADQVNRLASDYAKAQSSGGSLSRSTADAEGVASAANASYQKVSSTPILLLDLQLWLDSHGFKVDLHDKFGKALQQFSSQLASLVNNALGIALRAGNLLLNTALTLIISIYFLSDGGRFVRWLVASAPAESRDQMQYLVTRLDQILGNYLRAQVVIALLAATLDALGAVLLGVPYAIVIFFSSFFLSLIPVIGPVVLPLPPMLVAVVFTPLPTPIFYLVWLLLGEQLATNIVGPRLQGHSVGIHPLEAMAAALIGFPLAGFLGAFFAVPIAAFLHIVVHEIAHVRREGPPEQESGPTRSSA